jgi:hypothetical protein
MIHFKQDLLGLDQGLIGKFLSTLAIDNPSCSKDHIRPNPLQEDYFYKNRSADKLKFDESTILVDQWFNEYKMDVERLIHYMWNVFVSNRMVTSAPTRLYRSLIIPNNGAIQWDCRGCTSTSYSFKSAIAIANVIISKNMSIRPSTHQLVVFIIDAPAGISFLSSEICERFESEHEIILLSQFILHPTEKQNDAYSHYFLPVVLYSCQMEITADFPTYHALTFTDEDVVYGKRRRSKKNKKLSRH